MRKPGRCRDCGREFKDLRPHVRAEMRKINPRRCALIHRDVYKSNLTNAEKRELAALEKRADNVLLSLGAW